MEREGAIRVSWDAIPRAPREPTPEHDTVLCAHRMQGALGIFGMTISVVLLAVTHLSVG